MKEIQTETHVVPPAARSKNYSGSGRTVIIGGSTTIINPSVSTSGGNTEDEESDEKGKNLDAHHAEIADYAYEAGNLSEDSSDWDKISDIVQNAFGFAGENFVSKQHDDTVKGKITFENLITLSVGMMLGNARIVNAIQSGEEIQDTDGSIMTVAKMLGTFLRKDTEDETRYCLRLMGGAIFSMLKTPDYISGGMFGTGLGLYKDASGKWCIETDKLFVRAKAIFAELELRRFSAVNGNVVITAAGSRIKAVTDMGDYWRCTYEHDDGTTATMNTWRVGDQARCQTFNIKPGVYENVENAYWWRLVVGCGDGYIDISKSDCDTGSGAPAAGDVVVQLGNRTDVERQNAIVLATVDAGAPSITQYAGIDSYSLSGCIKTRISPSGNIFTGDFYLNDGRSILQVIDGKLTSVISEMVRTQSETDNYLRNGSFADNLNYWEYANGVRLLKVGTVFIFANTGLLSNRSTGAGAKNDDNVPVCYINNSSIRQKAVNYASVPEIKTGSDEKKVAVPVRLTLYYKVLKDGVLSIGFTGEDKTGFNDYQVLKYENTLSVDGGYKQLETVGYWGATGDLTIGFTGKIQIHSVVLWLDEYSYYETRIEQTAQAIRLEAKALSKDVDGIRERVGTLEVTAQNITQRVSDTEKGINGAVTRIGTLETKADGITATVESHTKALSGVTDRVGTLEVTAQDITQRVTSAESTLNGHSNSIGELQTTAESISATVESHSSSLTSINRRVGTLEVTAGSITQRVENAESTISGHTTRIGTLETKADGITAVVAQFDSDGNLKSNSKLALTIADDISSATIEADNINFMGKTIINRNFVVDDSGNLSISGIVHARLLYADTKQLNASVASYTIDPVNEPYYTYFCYPYSTATMEITLPNPNVYSGLELRIFCMAVLAAGGHVKLTCNINTIRYNDNGILTGSKSVIIGNNMFVTVKAMYSEWYVVTGTVSAAS